MRPYYTVKLHPSLRQLESCNKSIIAFNYKSTELLKSILSSGRATEINPSVILSESCSIEVPVTIKLKSATEKNLKGYIRAKLISA